MKAIRIKDAIITDSLTYAENIVMSLFVQTSAHDLEWREAKKYIGGVLRDFMSNPTYNLSIRKLISYGYLSKDFKPTPFFFDSIKDANTKPIRVYWTANWI